MDSSTNTELRIERIRKRLLLLTYSERRQRIPAHYATSGLVSPLHKKRWINREKKIRNETTTDVDSLLSLAVDGKTNEQKLSAISLLETSLDKMESKDRFVSALSIFAIPVIVLLIATVIEFWK